jgi:hypothetical protein
MDLISNVANPNPHHFGKPGPDLEPHQSEKPDPHRSQNLVAVRLNIESWQVCRPVVANSHFFDEEQCPLKVKSRIRIRINMDPVPGIK